MVRETRHLWVGNLPETVREDRIRDHFKRYGRVQSVKILLSSNCNPNLLLSIGSSSLKDHNDATDDHSISMYSFNSNNSNSSNNNNSNSVSNNNEATRCGTLRLCSPTTNPTNCNIGSVCATVAFMDIKSASKAHTAEHKFDDRVLTTEYYEPSSIPSTSGENSPSSISSSAQQQQTAQQQSPQHGSTTSNLTGSVQSVQQQYSSSAIVSPPAVSHRLSTSNHGSSEDLSPNFVDRNTSYYDRSTRLNESSTSDMYIRRPNNYHHSESRGRPRDRNHYRNGSYSSTVDRPNSSVLHRSTSNTWYDNTNSTSRNVYGTLPSAAVVVTPDSAYDTTNDRRTSETECSSKSTAQTVSHRAGASPCADSTTSRSHSRSPSSCSSRQSSSCSSSGSSHSHGSSSPSSSDPSKSKHLQSAVSTPPTTVHSDDNRPLAICVRNLPSRSSDTSLKDGLFHEYKKHGKVTWVKVVGQSSERYALVCFKKPEDVEKALEVSHDKLFFGCKIAVAPYQGFDVDDNEFRPYEAELDEFNPKSTRTLFIGNLEKDITTAELRKNFDCFGEIIEIEIKKQGANAYAFCQYSDIISVVKAIRAMDGEHLGMNRIKLGFGKSMATNCVWIDGVSDAVSENYLSTQFSRFGPVSQTTINRDQKMALVFFEQTQYAQSAVKEMRGIMLRGRKLQVDFASRECQDAFYEKLDKKGATTPERVFDTNRSSFDSSTTLNSRFSRSQSNFRSIDDDDSVKSMKSITKPIKTVIDTPGGRSRTSSFGRHGNTGAVSPTSGSSTPRSTFVRRNSRYANMDYHEDEYIPSSAQAIDQIAIKSGKMIKSSKLPGHEKSYDEVSQGSVDADDYNYFKDRSLSPQTRLANEMDNVAGHGRRKYTDEFLTGENRSLYQNASKVFTKSFQIGLSKVDGERRDRSPILDDDQYFNNSNKHHRIQSVVVSADTSSMHPSIGHFQAPTDIRHLQRSHLHEQPEDGPSSDDILSPNKRMKFENADSGNIVQSNLVNDTNCDLPNNLNDTNLLHHRKDGEVRRLSECNSLKHNAANNSIRRPSTDSGTLRHITQNDLRNSQSYSCIKRRKTGATNSESEHHSKGRGHQLHSHHSHEASASESADGSRPGTPLCDERPELPEPADPRRHTRERSTRSSPMYLSLPKFGVQTYNQIRAFNQTHSLSTYILTNNHSGDAMDHHTKVFNALSSPPPALLTRPTNSSSISLTSQHSSQISFQPNKQQQQQQTQQPQQPPHPNERSTLSNSNFTLSRNAHHKGHTNTFSSSSMDTATNQIHQSNAIEPKVTSHHSHSSQSTHTISTAPLPKMPHPSEPPKPLSIPPPPSEQPPESPIQQQQQQHNSLLNATEPPYHSNSSDSELANSPSFDERIKNLDEMFEKWNGGTLTKQGSVNSTEVSTPTSTTPSYSSRHKFLDLDVIEVKPSEIVKSVLAKKSIFDDDLKRLENIGEKYEASDYIFTRLTSGGSNAAKPIPTLTSTSQLPKLQTLTQQSTPIVQAHPRLNAVSPMNSPQPQSPYNSPSPSPIVTNSSKAHSDAANQKNQSICSVLQYPFPSHPIPANNSGDASKHSQDELNNKSKPHSNSRNSNHDKSHQSSNTNKTNSSNNHHRALNKSASVPVGSNHSGTVHPTLKTSCSLNAKDESNDSAENVIHEKRRDKREEKLSSKSDDRHSKRTELLDRRKWESTNTDHSDPITEHNNVKMELEKNKNKVRNHSEADMLDRESRIKIEIDDKPQNKKSEDFDTRRRELDNENIAQNWKNEYVKSVRNDSSIHSHRDSTITVNHFIKIEKHNKENSGKSRESTPLDRHNYNEDTRSDRNSRCNSPNKNTTKRRLSSHESVDSDDGKRFKFNQDRRDFKDPNNRSFDKSARHQRNKVNNTQKIDESLGDVEDRSKKDSMFDERKKERDGGEKHRKSEKNSSHKVRKNKDEKTTSAHYLDMESLSGFSSNDVRMSDEESRKSEHNSKENKRANLYEQQQQQQTSHRHHGDSKQSRESRESHREEKSKSEKRVERLNSGNEKSKVSSERRRQRIVSQLSSDDSDSDKKKRSIFDIPDDEPVYVSMYDKVKARSCKNMQKQEEEKKIKDKFSQLKESRAKREEKKQTSYDEDTDSDMERNPDRRPKNSNRPNPFMDSSTEDSDGRHSALKDMMISDSDTNSRNKCHFRRNNIKEIFDGESSENSSSQFQPKCRNSSRKNSRSVRITSETSDDASDSNAIKQELNPELKEAKVKIEMLDMNSTRPNEINNEMLNIPKEEKQNIAQFKIKTEPIDDPFNFDNQTPDHVSNVCDMSDGDSITPSSKASDGKESIFDNLFNADTNKRKHKKNKKRQKSPSVHSVEEVKPIKHETEIKIEKTNSMETVFDELKRDSTSSEKKRHSKKEKKRDKSSKEQHDKSKEEKYRMKKLKKQGRLASDASLFDSIENYNASQSQKRGERMENIFGPISDDDLQSVDSGYQLSSKNIEQPPEAQSRKPSSDSNRSNSHQSDTQKTSTSNFTNANKSQGASMPTLNSQPEPEPPMKSSSVEKDKHRERKREKKRKEREKQQQSISNKDDDNSVDLDAAARQLEAQLLEDTDLKPENDCIYSGSKDDGKNVVTEKPIVECKPYDDVFRFSDNEDAIDNVFTSRKSESTESHRSKDKKKKKKKSREEKRHHHHHSSHPSLMSPPTTPRLTIDTSDLDEHGTDMDIISHMENEQIENHQKNASQKSQISPSIRSQHAKHDDKHKDAKESTFDVAIDKKNHESAVQSIPSDLDNLPEMDKAKSPEKPPTPKSSKTEEKSEEKSRVVISQEETEDAVAALLGESFGTINDDYDDEEFNPTNEGNETSNQQVVDGALIAEEEAEEMRKAVQSLNTEELDMKPDTPQSDNGLQIDTDTEDQDDSGQLQIDVSASSEESKPDTPQSSEKSKALDGLTTPVSQQKTGEPSMQSTPITSNYGASKKDELSNSDAKPSKDKPLEPPQILPLPIPKKPTPESSSESTVPVKINAVLKQNEANEKAKATAAGTSPHHSVQAAAQPPQITTAALPSSIRNPLLNRAIAPQIRQPMHMNPAKSSLSHVVIQQRQIIPPVTQKSSVPQSDPIIIPNTSAAPTKPKESSVVESQTKPSTIEVAQTSVINTQMPQTPKQIVFETKIPHQTPIEINKPTDVKPAEFTKVNQQNILEQKLTDVKQEINVPPKSTEKIDDDVKPTPSLISCTPTTIKAEDVKPIDMKSNIEINTSTVKEDGEYWSAKEVNIESVIKKVDALCNTTEEETSIGSNSIIIKPAETVVQKMEDDLIDTNKTAKSEESEQKADTKIDGKCSNKRDKTPRSKKHQQIETPSAPTEVQKPVIATTESPSSGVQTRRGVPKTPVVPKRGRNNKNVSPKTAIPPTISGLETKPRNTNSESDIYEFHEDSGEESMANQSNDGTRSRTLSISKIHHQPSSPNVPVQVETSKQQQCVVTQPPVIVVPGSENKTTVPVIPPPNVLHDVEKTTVENAEAGDAKEDSSMAAMNNVRKSRRLIERDGSRSTVDDIIEDVVKNAQLSAKESPTVITTSASAAIIPTPNVQVIPAQPRRSTRNTSNQATTKLQPAEKVDVRKSPRNAKDRKTSECESSTDERIDEPPRAELGMSDEKRDGHHAERGHESENVRRVAEPNEPNKSEVPKQTIEQHAGQISHVNKSRIIESSTNELAKKPVESRALIDPVTGELTVVQQSNEGQYLPIMGGHIITTVESLIKPSVVVTTAQKEIRQPTIEVTASIAPKITTAPIVTIVNKTIQATGPTIVSHHAPKPQVTINSSVPTTAAPHNSYVITSKSVDPPPTHSGIPISMSIEKTLAQSQPQVQIKQNVQQSTPQPIPTSIASQGTSSRTHPIKAHVQTNVPTSVILSNSISTVSNVQPVIKTTPVIHCRETQPTVISQQYQPKIQVSVSQPSQMVHGKNTLTVNIPTSSPINLQPTHSPRLPHESQYSIHVPKHSVTNLHQPQILSQTPVVIHSNKMHAPVTSNYTSVVQAPKIIQTPSHLMQSQAPQLHQSISQSIAHTNPSMMVQMQSQPIPMQHMPQPQTSKPGTPHQITIQQQQVPQPFSANVQMQSVRSNSTKFKYPERYEGQPATVTKQPTFEHYNPQIQPSNRLHQPQIIAVASPPPKQPHLVQQQPTGANNLRVIPPPLSPQGQARAHNLQQTGLPAPGFESNLHSDLSGYGILRNQSPPPAHQQASPITPGDGSFPPAMRGVVQNHFAMYQQYIRAQEALGQGARIPYIPRTTLLPASSEQKELSEMEEQLGTSPPLELRRTMAAQRVAVPHSLQSPQDRATESPQVAQVYVPGTRIPHPHYPDARFYESARGGPIATPEPPPAHRNPMTPPTNYVPANEIQSHLHPKAIERERERSREREREQREMERKSSIPGHSNSPCPSALMPAMAAPAPGRPLQLQPVTTPPHASQVPQADSLLMLLQRYPVMWQGLLALKTDQAAVQMHFVFGNPKVASGSLPCNSDGSTPPLRIAQRMRLEQTQLEGVARKMQIDDEHCMLLALPCGRDHIDVLQQSTNLSSGFITYLQQKQAAGIVNIPAPGSEQAAYVVHIFPSCEFANENLARIAPDLLHRVSDLAHLLIVIATV